MSRLFLRTRPRKHINIHIVLIIAHRVIVVDPHVLARLALRSHLHPRPFRPSLLITLKPFPQSLTQLLVDHLNFLVLLLRVWPAHLRLSDSTHCLNVHCFYLLDFADPLRGLSAAYRPAFSMAATRPLHLALRSHSLPFQLWRGWKLAADWTDFGLYLRVPHHWLGGAHVSGEGAAGALLLVE